MRLLNVVAGAVALVTAPFVCAQAATYTTEAPTGFFVPDASQTYNSPYYRGFGEDWGWAHNSIATAFTTAAIHISAFDVDYSSGERDEIYAYDNGTPVFLGYLQGVDNSYSFTEFALGAQFFDDLVAGLMLEIRIDMNPASRGWLVSLAKSVVTTDGSKPGDPDPGETPAVPLPAAAWLLLGGVGMLGSTRLRRKA